MSSIRVPLALFKPNQDCVDLHRAVKGLGCDADTIIKILAHRNASQRCQIRSVYNNMFQEDICARLKSELHHHFEKAMLMWMRDEHERDAKILHKAMKISSATRQNRIFVETLSTKSSDDVKMIADAYHSLYGRPLQDAIEANMPGSCKKLFVMYLLGNRNDGISLDTRFADEDAKKLHSAIFPNLDEATISHILTSRSCRHLCSIFDAYRATHGSDLYETIERKGEKGTLEFCKTVMMIIKCTSRSEEYFAEVLYKSMKGLGTDDDTLIRVIIAHAEVDLENIKEAFSRRYNKHLSVMVHSDTTANYRKFLLALIGELEQPL